MYLEIIGNLFICRSIPVLSDLAISRLSIQSFTTEPLGLCGMDFPSNKHEFVVLLFFISLWTQIDALLKSSLLTTCIHLRLDLAISGLSTLPSTLRHCGMRGNHVPRELNFKKYRLSHNFKRNVLSMSLFIRYEISCDFVNSKAALCLWKEIFGFSLNSKPMLV